MFMNHITGQHREAFVSFHMHMSTRGAYNLYHSFFGTLTSVWKGGDSCPCM